MKTMKHFLAAFMMMTAASVWAAEPIIIKLWPNGAPNSNGATKEKPASNNQAWDFEPILTVWPAENPNGLAVLGLPGGGYSVLSNTHECKQFNTYYNEQGITFVCLDYRMPGGHKDVPLSDAQQAMRVIREHADEWGFTKLGVMGASAGGHLASTVATHYVDDATKPDFQILFYPVISMDMEITHQSSRELLLGQNPSEEDVLLFSNEKQVTKDTPKAFIIACMDDFLVPVENSIRYYQALVKNRVPAAMHLYPKGGHGFGAGMNFGYAEQWRDELKQWFKNEILNSGNNGGGFGGFGGFGGGFPGGGAPGGGFPGGGAPGGGTPGGGFPGGGFPGGGFGGGFPGGAPAANN